MQHHHTPFFHRVVLALIALLGLVLAAQAWGQGAGPVAAQAVGARASAPAGDTLRKRDPGLAKEQRSTVRKAKRALRRSADRARTGSAPVDASGR